mgnify:CR=1 FL=1
MFYQLPNNNLFTHHMLFSREKPLVKSTAPGLFSHDIFSDLYCYLPFYLFASFIFRSILPKPKNTSLNFICRYLHPQFYPVNLIISGTVTWKGLTTPLTRRVASVCYLCAGAFYVVLCGSPTGSITLASSLREIPTVVVLHHPFLLGEIPM